MTDQPKIKGPDPDKTNQASNKVMTFFNAVAETFTKMSEDGGNEIVTFTMDNGTVFTWSKHPIQFKQPEDNQ